MFKEKKICDLPIFHSLIFCKNTDSVTSVIELLKKNKIGSVVVVDETQNLKGIFTERDYILKIAGHENDLLQNKIEDFMTPDPKTVSEEEPIFNAASLMRLGKFRHLVVVDKAKLPRSVVSIKDIMDFALDNFNPNQNYFW